MISSADRQMAIEMIGHAVSSGARQKAACQEVGISVRTCQRWQTNGYEDRRQYVPRQPVNKLSDKERQAIIDLCNQPAYRSLSPKQIVPKLADRGLYLASESTFYRLLREKNMLHRRGRVKAPSHPRPDSYAATEPNQLWSWDITYLASSVKGLFFYLYLFMDIYSRKVVGWEVYLTFRTPFRNKFVGNYCRDS